MQMRRRVALFLGLVLTATVVLLAPSSPVQAKACAGQGNAHLGKKIGLPVIGAQTNVPFSITAKCTVGGGTGVASGSIASAACGRSTGGVGTINGKPFTFQTAASIGIISGSVKGAFNAVADTRKGDSCATKTADDFLVTAVINGL
jgi:hypothetical protein